MTKNSSNSIIGYEFSENQKNLWMLGNDNLGTYFNQISIELKDKVTKEKLLHSIEKVIRAQPVLNYQTNYNKKLKF